METKEEINKKKGNFEQLDLVETVDEAQKIKNKRLIVCLFLFLSVGLSVGFWFFRSFDKNNFSFSIPEINISLFDQVKKDIKSDPNSWSLCFFDSTKNKVIFSSNCSTTAFSPPASTNTDFATSVLPPGLSVIETLEQNGDTINYLTSISSPRNRFILSAKIFGSNSLDNSKIILKKVIESLYWRFSSP